MEPIVIFESRDRRNPGRSFRFSGCRETVYARRPEEVAGVLAQVETATRQGLHAAGFLTYEAAPGFDSDLEVRQRRADDRLPLAWFGFFNERQPFQPSAADQTNESPALNWRGEISLREYTAAIDAIRAAIARGDTYQVNFTQRLRSAFHDDPYSLWRSLLPSQSASFCAFIDIGSHAILSLSPELFFHKHCDRIRTRPMKGTSPRGRTTAEDLELSSALRNSEKNRAENVMIVDLLRNDLGRLAEFGSVRVEELFTIERYETVLQMTSQVAATLRAGTTLSDIFRALFPCGSVTGAPKISTMRIIRHLERSPRGVYCGAIGFVSPDGEAVFNVPIRTITVDRAAAQAEYGVGGGITWDSTAAEEYQECLDKAEILTATSPEFDLLETLRWDPREGWILLDRHLLRMADSADYFAYTCDETSLRGHLARLAATFDGNEAQRVRLLLSRDGVIRSEAAPLPERPDSTIRPAVLAVGQPVRSTNRFLFHKTTFRKTYDDRKRLYPDGFEVLLVNENGLVTESTTANLVVEIAGELLTPPVSEGLLPGVMRQELIESGELREGPISIADLKKADKLFLVNSVRGMYRIRISTEFAG